MTFQSDIQSKVSSLLDKFGVNVERKTRGDAANNADYQDLTITYTSQGNIKAILLRPREQRRHAAHGERTQQVLELMVKGSQAVEPDDHYVYDSVEYDVDTVHVKDVLGTPISKRVILTEAKST